MNKKERALVTGGAGFIGGHLVEHLVGLGHFVRVADDFSTGKRENLAAVEDRVELIHEDLAAQGVAARAVKGCDWIFHLAAIPSVARSVADPALTHRANVDGTLAVLLAAKDGGAKRVVYASSSSVYGDTPTLPKREDMPVHPLSPYACQKLAGEVYALAFTHSFGLPCVALRYFNVFGPRQDPASLYAAVIPRFISALLAGESPTIYGDGEQTRDFTFIRNVCEANLAAALAPDSAMGRAYNVACGQRISLLKLVELLQRITGARKSPVFEKTRAGDVKHSLADIVLAKQHLGWTPEVGLEEGLRQTVEWYRKA